jgi:hypothetical protein
MKDDIVQQKFVIKTRGISQVDPYDIYQAIMRGCDLDKERDEVTVEEVSA